MKYLLKFLNKLLFAQRLLRIKAFKANVKINGYAAIGEGSFLSSRGDISIGKNFYCGSRCYLSGDIKIGDGVMLASSVAIVGGDHRIDNVPVEIFTSGRGERRLTTIADFAWIGHGAIILNGVNIGRGSVIGAGSVVTHDVQDLEIVVGNPARHVRFRNISN